MLLLVKYGLPICLSYTLFVGIAGQFNPFRIVSRKALYMLAAWTSLCVLAVLVIGINLAYGRELQNAEALIKPLALLTGLLVLPAFIAFFVHQRTTRGDAQHHEQLLAQELNELHQQASSFRDDATKEEHLASAFPTHIHKESIANRIAQTHFSSSNPVDKSHETNVSMTPDRLISLEQTVPTKEQKPTQVDRQPEQPSDEKVEADSSLDAEETGAEAAIILKLQRDLEMERERRTEMEKHLQVTRKALSALEEKATVEELKLASQLAANRENSRDNNDRPLSDSTQFQRRKKDPEISELRKSLANAKQEIRRGIAARAKALSTANQSIALARQALKTRSRLENELQDTRASLTNRQAAVNSLIKALDKEKRRTAEDVNQIAKQLLAESRSSKKIHADP